MLHITLVSKKKAQHHLQGATPNQEGLVDAGSKACLKCLPCSAQLDHLQAPARLPLTPRLLFSTFLPTSRAGGWLCQPSSGLSSMLSFQYRPAADAGEKVSKQGLSFPMAEPMGFQPRGARGRHEPGLAARLSSQPICSPVYMSGLF